MAAVTTNLTSHHFSQRQQLESTDGSMDSNDISNHYGRESPSIDNNSCCSDDTVLSVGKETPPPNQTLSFKNIESHLNAISQLTNATLGEERIKHYAPLSPSPHSPLSNRLSPMSTKSMESPSYAYKSDISESKSNPNSPIDSSVVSPLFRPGLTTSSPEPSPKSLASPKSSSESLFFRQTPVKQNETNNDANNASLKFSIDNILKADFGRRITDPINIKKSKPKKSSFEDLAAPKAPGPVDLSKAETEKPTASSESNGGSQPMLWPAWVYCTRYSDRPSSGRSPRSRRVKKPCPKGVPAAPGASAEEKRPRTAFSGAQLARLKHEFAENRYLTERRRQQLSAELGLNEAQIKIWFQNKRAKIKKASGQKNPLALQLMAQGLYNHSTVPLTREEEELQELQNKKA